MLLPGLNTQSEYVRYAEQSGLRVFSEPFDISKQVSKTWYVLSINKSTSEGFYGLTLLTRTGIYRGHWSRIQRYGPLPYHKVEMD